jgi:phosphoserine phosphatase RsbU/P
VERASDRLAILHALTAGLAERMEVKSIASFVLGVGLTAIEANRGTLCLLTADGASLEVVAHAGYDTTVMESWRLFAVDAPLPASDAVRSRSPIYLHSPRERAERYPIFATTGGDGASAMLPLITRDEPLGAIVFGFDGERDFDDADRSFLAALTTQCAIALDRARLYEAALRRQADLVLLADAATVLARAGDAIDDALQQFVDMVAPDHVDICSVHLLDSARASRLAATGGASAFDADLEATDRLDHALRTGQEVAWDGGIIVPMLSRGRVLGACVFANHRHRPMSDEDRRLARTLGERAGVLLDNGHLMQQRKEVSHGLQAALLPSSLPHIPGFDIGARYQSAGEGLEVGGDFYDVVPMAAGSWLLVVGDVTGHGVEAAAATSLVRHTIRSAAMIGMSPSAILDHANNAMRNGDGALPSGMYCTIALVAFTTPTDDAGSPVHGPSRVVVSCGGHPPPLVRRVDGRVEQLASRGRLLGYFQTVEADETVVQLAPGDTLVAFTDGVIERHSGSSWFREHDLMTLVSGSDVDADSLAGRIRDTVVDAFAAPPTDDMAILVLRRLPT